MTQRNYKRKSAPKKETNWFYPILILLCLGLFISAGIYRNFYQATNDAKFKKEGTLVFQTTEKELEIDIEIAEGEYERMKGLMHRKQMDEDHGMLFIMELEEEQSFWMKNTYIPLDIIYVNEDFEIVTIQENTVPHSLKSVLSNKPARYVVEVNAGYCKKYGVKEGDKISFQRI